MKKIGGYTRFDSLVDDVANPTIFVVQEGSVPCLAGTQDPPPQKKNKNSYSSVIDV